MGTRKQTAPIKLIYVQRERSQETAIRISSVNVIYEGVPPIQVPDMPPPKWCSERKKKKEEETNSRRISQRKKQIAHGRATSGYRIYKAMIAQSKRAWDEPRTPNIYQVCSKRSWDGQVRVWRCSLHRWDPAHVARRSAARDATSPPADTASSGGSASSAGSWSEDEDDEDEDEVEGRHDTRNFVDIKGDELMSAEADTLIGKMTGIVFAEP